jgi:hypothetical protein
MRYRRSLAYGAFRWSGVAFPFDVRARRGTFSCPLTICSRLHTLASMYAGRSEVWRQHVLFPFRPPILGIAYSASPERRTHAALGWVLVPYRIGGQRRRLS